VTDFSRQAVWWLEIKPDRCANTYGVAPCTAAGAAGTECYNTFGSCQDKPNYVRGTKSYHFISISMVGPSSQLFRPYVEVVKTSPTVISRKDGLARRAEASITLLDEPDSDIQQDPYIATRAAAQGTFWSRFIARNLHLVGREAILRRAYLTGAWDDSAFSEERYIIESVSGPDKGKVVLTLKDPVKLVDRTKVPLPTSGKLALALGTSDLQLTMNPGDGAQYAASGYVRVKDEIIRYTGKKPVVGWGFNNSVDGWNASGASLTARPSSVLLASSSADPVMNIGGLAIPGGTYRYVIAKLRRIAGSGWQGWCYFTTGSHGISGSYYKAISQPSWPAFTNALKYSEDFSNTAAWSLASGAIVTPDTWTAPDGEITGDTITDADGAGWDFAQQAGTIQQNVPHTASVHIEKDAIPAGTRQPLLKLYYDASNSIQIAFDSKTGEYWIVGSYPSCTLHDFGVKDMGDVWRIWIAAQTSLAISTLYWQLFPSANPGGAAAIGSVNAWGAMLANGVSVLTPYIQTEDLPAGDFVITVWDMHALTAGGNDWSQNTITGLRLDLGNSSADQFEIEWVALSPNPASQDDVLVLGDGTNRAQYGTSAGTAKIGDGVQQCMAWSDAPLTTVMRDILRESGLDFDQVDVAGMAAEEENWLGAKYHITHCLSEPENADKLVAELCIESNGVGRWDPLAQKFRYLVVTARPPSESFASALTDEASFVGGSVKVTPLDDQRLTYAAIFYDLASATADMGQASNYLNGEIRVDADAESANEYGDERNLVVKSRWFKAANEQAMRSFVAKKLINYRDAPKQIEFTLTPKDADIREGDLYQLATDSLVGFDGAAETQKVLIVKRWDDGKGNIRAVAETTVFNRRYAFVAPAGHPDYLAATEAERAYAFVCNTAGKMSNGDDGYIVI